MILNDILSFQDMAHNGYDYATGHGRKRGTDQTKVAREELDKIFDWQKNLEVCGDGLDNDLDGTIDEGCGFRLYATDSQCKDGILGVKFDGKYLGYVPAGHDRYFDISGFTRGKHTVRVRAYSSGSTAYGCSSKNRVSYELKLPLNTFWYELLRSRSFGIGQFLSVSITAAINHGSQ